MLKLKYFVFAPLAVGAICLLIYFCSSNSKVSNPFTQIYDHLKQVADPELSGVITISHSEPGEDFEWRLATFHADDKTPKVYKDLMKPQPYINLGAYGIRIRYQYFRADGTLERRIIINPSAEYGTSCLHQFVDEEYSANGKVLQSAVYFRSNGDIAATFEQTGAHSDVWSHYRVDGSLAHVQENKNGDYSYIHYRKNGKDIWYIDSGKTCKVFYDWRGNALSKQFTRRSLFKGNGYSYGEKDPPLPVYEDSYTRPDGSLEYRQTWTVMARNGQSFNALSKLEIFSPDGKQLVRVIELEPKQFAEKRVVISDKLADGSAPSKGDLVQEYMFDGFSLEMWDWKLEYANDV